MYDNLNIYGYQEENYLYTYRQETHDWRKHTDKHLEEVKDTIVSRVDAAENNIKAAITASENVITNKIGEVQTYLSETIKPELDSINSTATSNNSVVNNIWNKIRNWEMN